MLVLLAALVAQASPVVTGTSCAGGLITAPAGTRCPFLLFFDSAEAELSRDSAATLEQILPTYRDGGFHRIALVAHSDRSGPSSANLRIARLRAEAVKSWLIERGASPAIITVRAVGEAQPIIATADGVREPQNRRVEVWLER